MPGIAGIFNRNGDEASLALLQKMTNSIAHRGPDGEFFFSDRNAALGIRCLSLIDPQDSTQKSWISRDRKTAVAYDGYLLNHYDLRRELETRGRQFETRHDAEILLHAYEEEGIGFVERLDGLFAFALWDSRLRRLFLARDRYGIKPLYYWRDRGSVVFASEIKAILAHPQVSTRLNPAALSEYFTFQNLYGDTTFFEGIHLAPSATIQEFGEGNFSSQSRPYWDYNFSEPDLSLTREDAVQQAETLLERSVKHSLISDVPLGCYLLGGMSYSALVALASRFTPNLSTFTFGFHLPENDDGSCDDRAEAELTAHSFKTEHYGMVINSSDIQRSLAKVVFHLEDLRLGMIYHEYYLARLASKFVKICLSPIGGNELFAEYPWRYYHSPRPLDEETYIRNYYQSFQVLVPPTHQADLLAGEILRASGGWNNYEIFRSVFQSNKRRRLETPEDQITASHYFECKTFLHGSFVALDRISSANGVQERFPFMANDLVDFAQRIPLRYKIADWQAIKPVDENQLRKLRDYRRCFGTDDTILNQILLPFVPSPLIHSQNRFFYTPDETWFRGKTLPYVRELLLNPRAACRDYLQSAYIRTIVEEHANGTKNHRLLIWALLCFEWWCKIFLDNHPVE